jgi:hypothetical protein
LNYTFPYTGGMIHGYIKGLNQLACNSDKQFLEGSLDFNYSIPKIKMLCREQSSA